jgi:two-component system, response regulator, stage 0 sporulation protein F
MTPPAELVNEPVPRLRHVLVAEDHLEMRWLLVSLLQSEGHQVVEASDGLKALAALLRRPGKPEIDLLVTDLRMPGCSGLDLLAFVRLERPEMPVVLITAFGDSATHLDARRLGAAAVLDKPFDLHAFRDVVRALVRGTGG